MHTSAGTLRQTLNNIGKNKSPIKLSVALAKYFNLEGDNGEFEAVSRVISLSRDVIRDIDDSDFDAQAKKALKQNFNPFLELTSFEIYAQTTDHLNKNILREANLNQLYTIDMALDGKLNRFSDDVEQSDLSKEFQSVRESVINSSLPDELKSAIVDRLNKVITAIDHFRIWGPQGLKESLIRLVGEVVMEVSSEEKERELETFNKLASKITKATNFINKAAETTRGVKSIVDSGVKVAGSIEGIIDKL